MHKLWKRCGLAVVLSTTLMAGQCDPAHTVATVPTGGVKLAPANGRAASPDACPVDLRGARRAGLARVVRTIRRASADDFARVRERHNVSEQQISACLEDAERMLAR